jgi:hypothetical protein
MFYARINKIKVFDNREGFLWFNKCAEMQIYSYVRPLSLSMEMTGTVRTDGGLAISELMELPDANARRQRLLDAVLAEAGLMAQSSHIEINGVRDNQTLLFGDSGLAVFSSGNIPDGLDIRLWVIESDGDVRNFAIEADRVIDSDAFKGLYAAVETALAISNPLLSGVIALGGVAVALLRQKLRANKDDLAGYWQATLNRAEHYPHGTRDKKDVYDTTGNILVDYTLFGFENLLELKTKN